MAKNLIEKAPFKFDISLFKEMYAPQYLYYKAVDEKGRYLYWDEFKWRVKEGDDPQKAWWATKWTRVSQSKFIELFDKDKILFSFCVPDNLQAKLFKISDLARQGIIPHNSIKKNYLISSLVMEESISSSQLEGASTTRKVAKEMLTLERKPRTDDEQMILNNYLLMKEVKQIQSEELSIGMILQLHAIATKEDTTNGNIAGQLRNNNEITVMDGDDNIVHHPPCFREIEKRLKKICHFANTEHQGENGTIFINPIIKAIILHFIIGYEHPFSDGNGRTARAIFYWFMLKNGFDYFEYISISKLLKEAPKKYSFSYLYSEIDDNDLTYFIYYQVDIIHRAIADLLKYLEKKSIEFEEVGELLQDFSLRHPLNFVQKDIIKKAIKEAGRIFTAKEIAIDYDISATSARKYLNELAHYKILIDYKEDRTKAYIAPAKLYTLLKGKQ